MAHRTVSRRYSPMRGAAPFECIYCGEPAEHIDHVLPVRYSNWRDSLTPVERDQLVTVPACAECNIAAGSKAFHSVVEKRDHIRQRLRKRYAKLLSGPVWTECEMDDLGPGLRPHIEATQAKRRLLVWRLAHEGIPAEAMGAVPITDEPMPCDLCGEPAWCSTVTVDGVLALACPACTETTVSSAEERENW